MKPEKIERLSALIAIIEDRLIRNVSAGDITDELEEAHDARFQFVAGTYQMTLAGIRGSCTAGGACVFRSWLRAARRAILSAQAAEPRERPERGRADPLAALVAIVCLGGTVAFWAWILMGAHA